MRSLTVTVALLLAASLLVVSPAAAQVTVPAEIDATCVEDETDALNAFFAEVPDGSTVTFPAAACYRHENSLHATWSGVTVEGNGVTLRADTDGSGLPAWDGKQVNWPRQRHHIRLIDSHDVTIRGLNIDGPNTAATYSVTREGQHGFAVAASSNILLDGVTVTDVWGDCVSFVGGSSVVTVQGGTFNGCGRQGFGIDEADDVLLDGFAITRVARSAVDVEPQLTWEVHRVEVRNGTFRAPIANAIVANLGTGAAVTDFRFTGNRVEGRSLTVQSSNDTPGERARFLFDANVATGATNTPPTYRFGNVTDVIVTGNTQPFAGKNVAAAGAAVRFDAGACGVVSGNSFPVSPSGQMVESAGVVGCDTVVEGGCGSEVVPAVEATPATPATGSGS
jgi:hypothetical protein